MLKPGGTFHFVEHGLAPDDDVQRRQHRFEPIQKRLFGGYHLTRPIAGLLTDAGFTINELDMFYEDGAPKSWVLTRSASPPSLRPSVRVSAQLAGVGDRRSSSPNTEDRHERQVHHPPRPVPRSAIATMAATAAGASADAAIDTDLVLITDSGIDFGDNTYLISAPIGWGSVEWNVTNGYYTPTLSGYMHLDNVSGQYGRMHMSYRDGGGHLLYTRSQPFPSRQQRRAPNSSGARLAVDAGADLEVHVCTELSPNGSTWTQIGCKTYEVF